MSKEDEVVEALYNDLQLYGYAFTHFKIEANGKPSVNRIDPRKVRIEDEDDYRDHWERLIEEYE